LKINCIWVYVDKKGSLPLVCTKRVFPKIGNCTAPLPFIVMFPCKKQSERSNIVVSYITVRQLLFCVYKLIFCIPNNELYVITL
jgi:hypothetical protein